MLMKKYLADNYVLVNKLEASFSSLKEEEITKKIIQKLYGSNKELISNDKDLLEYSNGCLSNKSNKNNNFSVPL